MDLGVRDQRFGLITDDLTNDDRQGCQPFVQASVPGEGVPLRLVLFQEDEVGGQIHGHQTDLRVKGFVLREGDLAGWHLGGQTAVFLLAKFAQQQLHFFRHRLLGTIGGRHEFLQAAEFQKLTEVANAAVRALHENQLSCHEQLV